jgi:alpha-beta hydrolase superfamily lysophospholipase
LDEGGPTIEQFTAGDGYRWAYRRWRPGGEPRAHLVFLHGIQSHGGWYERSCGWLCRQGFAVDFLDRRGSGLNEQDRGDARRFRRLLDDIGEFLTAQPRLPGVPRVLAGISWGGKLAAALPYRHPGRADAVALLCPGLCPKVRPPLGERLAIALSYFMNPTRPFPIPLHDPALFTASPAWQKFIADDPLGLRQATARFLVLSTLLDVYLKRAGKALNLPVLLLIGGQDRIIDNPRTRRLVGSWPTDATVIEYPEAHHTLEFEPDPERWRTDLRQWVERLAAPHP